MKQLSLKVRALSKSYDSTQALQNLNLDAYAGEVLAVLGKNGAGKTTFIHSVLGMQSYEADIMEILGVPMSEQSRSLDIRQQVGVMMQVGALNANLTVFEQLDLFCSYYPNGELAADLIEDFGLTKFAQQRFGKLSGGQRQQVLFAIAVAGKPELLFLDEPTVGMDVEARHALWEQIQQRRKSGCAIVLTTHYIEEAERLADRVAILREGEIVANGTLTEVIADHSSLEAAYLHHIKNVSAKEQAHA
ncbi:ABC transporter ATP-binding protein [Pseudidiomarina aestuarii]|uniref:ABC transporter ATP-binding protein n=1 Tax=Pseudidiomarina aestuarii TaxID=624146 RepID=A0A2T4D4K5_9GAMM|nr:ABC transporter ATP-binding protein [Pseudidiomarina aestuarii]